MKHLAILTLLGLATACSGNDDASGDGAPCFSNDDCSGACFLGSCVDVGFGLSTVSIDVQPPKSSSALRQRVVRTVDPSAGAQTVTLASTVYVTGAVTSEGSSVDGDLTAQLVDASDCQPTEVTDAATTYTSTTDRRGYTLAVTPGAYRVTFTPAAGSNLPPLTYPITGCSAALEQDTEIDLTYPETLVALSGRIRYSANDSTGVAGAQVIASSVDANGTRWESSSVETGSDGGFALTLPLSGETFSVAVRGGSNANVPTVTFDGLVRDSEGSLGEVTLNVSAPVSLQVSVVGPDGAPLADTAVTATGTVGGGTLAVSGATATAGTVTLSLRAGTFAVQASPRRTETSGFTSTTLTLAENSGTTKIVMTTVPKASVSGRVTAADGTAVPNAKVTFHLTNTTTSDRDVSATTDTDGSYDVLVDSTSPDGGAAEHEVTVDPSSESQEPRTRELLRIESSVMSHDIQLFSASFFYGTVTDASGVALPATALLFYSSDLGGDSPLLVGVAQSDTLGEFAVPLPQPDAGQ